DELEDVLLMRPLTLRHVGDVVWSGLWQRVRGAEPSTILGVASMFVILTGFVLAPGRYDHEKWAAVLRPTTKTLPTVTVTFLTTEFYVLLLIGCGLATFIRRGTVKGSGVAAMRMTLIACIPIMLGGLLYAGGLIDVIFFRPGEPATPLSPSALAMTTAPLF